MFFKRKMNKQRKEKGYCDQDLNDISYWFLTVVPNMLTEFNENRHGYPSNLEDREWTKIINQMIYYFREANEETCSRQDEVHELTDKYINFELPDYILKYGGISTENVTIKDCDEWNKANERNWNKFRICEPDKYREYEQIKSDLLAKDIEIYQYRNECKEKAFKLFTQYFWDLWD